MDSHAKAALKAASKLAAGGLTKKQKRKAVHQWAEHLKALIRGGK